MKMQGLHSIFSIPFPCAPLLPESQTIIAMPFPGQAVRILFVLNKLKAENTLAYRRLEIHSSWKVLDISFILFFYFTFSWLLQHRRCSLGIYKFIFLFLQI